MSHGTVEISRVEEENGKVYDAEAQLNETFPGLIDAITVRDSLNGNQVLWGIPKLVELSFPTTVAKLREKAERTTLEWSELIES